MKSEITWNTNNKMILLSKTYTNHAIIMDSSKNIGGNNLAPRPMEFILLGTGGCTMYDIISILKKNKQNINNINLIIFYKRKKINPKIFEKINFHFIIKGNFKKKIFKNAINLSHKKYCSASFILEKTVNIICSFQKIF